ncbi:porin [Pelagicoccus albus]|uniref:Phosphate-selective porin O and P n=1 Tax=Pelagicoccus albus TaxID=415222 RepID=A0A7X1B416_9BACT|nr:porin [Pelagicoccus albus]MBC2605147.1 hypothetical protein [Pelagicoccus albus]
MGIRQTKASTGFRLFERNRKALVLGVVSLMGHFGGSIASSQEVNSGASDFFSENLSLSGRFHPQFDHLDSNLTVDGEESELSADRLFFRRFMAGVKLDLNKQLRINYLADVSDRVVKNQVARLEIQLGKRDKLFVGYQKSPFGYEDTTSSANVKPIERSANTRFWNEVVGIGSYHAGVYQYHDFGDGWNSVFGVTHNVKADSDWPDLFGGDFASYLRLSKKGTFSPEVEHETGVDLAYKPLEGAGDIFAASVFSNLSFSEIEVKFEATAGEIDQGQGETNSAIGWHLQGSRMFGDTVELLVRYSQVDTDGYKLKLSSAIRKAPSSGYTYENVDSLYLGSNFYLKGNNLKLSLGYEWGEGSNALSGPGPLNAVEEIVSGFRARTQIKF